MHGMTVDLAKQAWSLVLHLHFEILAVPALRLGNNLSACK